MHLTHNFKAFWWTWPLYSDSTVNWWLQVKIQLNWSGNDCRHCTQHYKTLSRQFHFAHCWTLTLKHHMLTLSNQNSFLFSQLQKDNKVLFLCAELTIPFHHLTSQLKVVSSLYWQLMTCFVVQSLVHNVEIWMLCSSFCTPSFSLNLALLHSCR